MDNILRATVMKAKLGEKKNNGQGKYNQLKWALIFIILLAGFILNAYYNEVAWALRATGGIALTAILLAIAYQTTQGQAAWVFIKGARSELRKVVWPTRPETMQTTLVVAGMVVLAAVILWGLDTLLVWIIGLLTGQRG